MNEWILECILASPADFFAGADDITKERESLGSRSWNTLPGL